MALFEWGVFEDFPITDQERSHDGSPILDDRSLKFEHTGTTAFSHANLIPQSSFLPTGTAPAGKLRTICRIDTHDGVSPQVSYFGVTALQSQDDLTTSGSCYALLVSASEGLVAPRLHLHKFTSGLTDELPFPSLVDIPYPGGLTIGVPFAIELQWIEDVGGIGGVFLAANTGTQTDYSDLTTQITFVDTSSPLTVSVSEGIVGSFKNNVGGDTKKVLFDNTTLFELV